MTISKHILILANSTKHYPSVCIAGREIISNGQSYSIGPWVRPVSDHDEGALAPEEIRLKQKRQPQVFDIVDIELNRNMNDVLQPENWLIEAGETWNALESQYQRPSFDLLVEQPVDLWVERHEKTDRISPAALKRNPPAQSLYLIYLDEIKLSFGWKEWKGKYKKKRRALFSYNGVDYDLSITDPIALNKYQRYPREGQNANEFVIGSGKGLYLCVSLAPEIYGYHFKVAATIFET